MILIYGKNVFKKSKSEKEQVKSEEDVPVDAPVDAPADAPDNAPADVPVPFKDLQKVKEMNF